MKINTQSSTYEYKGNLITYFADSRFKNNNYVIDMTLKNAQLWASDPKNFNDPFDCRVPINSLNPSSQNLIIEEVNSMILSGLGIRCFVKDIETSKNDQLMWAHYADKGNGVCLVFNPEKDQEYFNPNDIIGVEYLEKIPPFNIKDINTLEDNDGDYLKLKCYSFGIKSEQWNYENEIRVVKECCPFNIVKQYFSESFGKDTPEVAINTISEKIQIYTSDTDKRNFKFKKEALTEVRLGYNLSKCRVEEIKNIFQNNGYDHVKIKQSRPNYTIGQIEYDDLT